MNYLTAEEVALLRNGQFVQAVKSARTRTGMSLIDAKHLVDAYGVAGGWRVTKSCPYCAGSGTVTEWAPRPEVAGS